MRTRPRALARTSILGLLAGGLASAAYQALSEARDRRRFPPPGELVDIDGRRLHLWRAGEGSPAVVIATSLGEPGHGWADIQRRLAQHTTVVLYDRAGLGWSEEGPWPTGKRIVEDLHALLHVTRIPPPYVLVGHSAGGLHVRLYAARHPEQVAGLVLVDSSHPHQGHRLRQRCGGWRFSRPRGWLQVAKVAFRPLGLARLRGSLRARYGHGGGGDRAQLPAASRRRPGAARVLRRGRGGGPRGCWDARQPWRAPADRDHQRHERSASLASGCRGRLAGAAGRAGAAVGARHAPARRVE